MPADGETRAQLVGRWLLAGIVPSSAMALGTLHTWTLIVVTVAAAVSCFLVWTSPPRRIAPPARWVLIAFVVLVCATLLQSIPLPAAAVSMIAPANADVWARSLSPLREPGPAWHTISVTPGASRVELVRGMLYGCVFLASLRVTLSEDGGKFLGRVVIASTATVALVSLAHASVHATTVFGFYQPHDAYAFPTGRLGPILNGNHLAAYMNLGTFVGAGLALAERRIIVRVVSAGCALLLAGTSVWAGSRGGTSSLLVGAVVFAAMTFATRRRGTRGSSQATEALVIVLALLAAGALVGIGSSDVARDDLGDRDLSKIELAKTASRLIPLSPVFGIGRGAFETMYPLFHESAQYVTYLRVENVVVQWCVEWGIGAAFIAMLALAAALRPAVVLGRERPPIGTWVAVFIVAIHDLVDFHLEVPAIVVAVAVCVASIVGARGKGSEQRASETVRVRQKRVAWTVSGAAIAASLVVVPSAGQSLAGDRDEIAKLAADPRVSPERFREVIRPMMRRYPAEPFFALAGAVHSQVTGTGSVVPWIARALERYPAFGRAHLVLARSLVRRSPAQARLEYRLAYVADTALRATVAREAPSLVDGEQSALDLVPDGDVGTPLLEQLAIAVRDRLPATAARLDAEVIRRDATAAGPLERQIEATISDLAHQHPWCIERAACVEPALATARELIRRHGDKCRPHVLLANVRIAAGYTSAALIELSKSTDTLADRVPCLRALVQLANEHGDRRQADEALDRALRGGCGTRDECVGLYAWAASIEERRGNPMRAIAFYKRASALAPEDDSYLERVLALSSQANLVAEAIEANRTLAARHPDDPKYAARATELRAKMHERRLDALPSGSGQRP